MIDQDKNYCPICDAIEDDNKNIKLEKEHVHGRSEQDEVSFAVLLALIPAMTMTLFNMMGLI
jgi:hypothetical protein